MRSLSDEQIVSTLLRQSTEVVIEPCHLFDSVEQIDFRLWEWVFREELILRPLRFCEFWWPQDGTDSEDHSPSHIASIWEGE